MRRLGLLAFPAVVLTLLLTSCAPAEDPFPTEWPELEAVDGVISVGVREGDANDLPLVRVQLDDRAEPADLVRAAVEVRDAAAELAPLADGYDLGIMLVRPGDYPAGSSAWWEDGTQSEDDFEAIVATLTTYGLPYPATKVVVDVWAYDGEHYNEWWVESFVPLDEPDADLLEDGLRSVAAEQGLELDRLRVEKGFPSQ